MKTLRIILLIILVSALMGCAPVSPESTVLTMDGTFYEVTKAEIVSKGTGTLVYKFSDGSRTCYFTEDSNIRVGSGIWCTP